MLFSRMVKIRQNLLIGCLMLQNQLDERVYFQNQLDERAYLSQNHIANQASYKSTFLQTFFIRLIISIKMISDKNKSKQAIIFKRDEIINSEQHTSINQLRQNKNNSIKQAGNKQKVSQEKQSNPVQSIQKSVTSQIKGLVSQRYEQLAEKAKQFFSYFLACNQEKVCGRCDQTFNEQNLSSLFQCNHSFCQLCRKILAPKFNQLQQINCPVQGCSVKISNKSNQNDQNQSSQYFQVCKICQIPYEKQNLRTFGVCNHAFCETCLKTHIHSKINAMELINCPQEGCMTNIDELGEAYNDLATPQQKKKYKRNQIQLRILSDPNLRACKKQTCDGLINLKVWRDQIKSYEALPILCPVCNLEYCKQCFDTKHDGQMCDKEMIQFLQRNNKFRRCGHCKQVVERSVGCDFMRCLCGNTFCYACGQYKSETGGHECVTPENLTYLQKIRWEMDHSEMFYEKSILSFGSCLYRFDLSGKVATPLRVLYSIVYALTFYPISIGLFLLLISLIVGLITIPVPLVILASPVICIFNKNFAINQLIQRKLGRLGLIVCVIFFYPIFILAILIEIICQEQRSPNLFPKFISRAKQVGIGLRNVLFMPFVLCVNPDSLDNPNL